MGSTLTLVLASLGAAALTAALACGGPDLGRTGESSPQSTGSEEPIVGGPEPTPHEVAQELECLIDASSMEAVEKARLVEFLQQLAEARLGAPERRELLHLLINLDALELVLGGRVLKTLSGLESAAVGEGLTESARGLLPEDLEWADDTLELEQIPIELRSDGRVLVDGTPLDGATTEDLDGLGSSLRERLSRRLEGVERCLLRPDLTRRGLPAARVSIRSQPAVRAEALPIVFEVCVLAELWDLRYELLDAEGRADPEHSFRLLVPFDYSPGRPFDPLELRVEVLQTGSERGPVTEGAGSGEGPCVSCERPRYSVRLSRTVEPPEYDGQPVEPSHITTVHADSI